MSRRRRNLGGFSWRRAVGVTRVKGRVSRATGIPLTRSGRQRRVGRMLMGQGCVVFALVPIGTLVAVLVGVGR